MQMAITVVHKRCCNSSLFAVGFSAGSNQLVKYLGMHSGEHPVTAAVSVCNGFEYEKHLKRIEQTTLGHDVYSRGMTYLHQEYLRTHKEELEKIDGFDLQKVTVNRERKEEGKKSDTTTTSHAWARVYDPCMPDDFILFAGAGSHEAL